MTLRSFQSLVSGFLQAGELVLVMMGFPVMERWVPCEPSNAMLLQFTKSPWYAVAMRMVSWSYRIHVFPFVTPPVPWSRRIMIPF